MSNSTRRTKQSDSLFGCLRHNDVRKLAEAIGNECQEAAEDANRIVETVDALDQYETHEGWAEDVFGLVEELVSTLDILKDRCASVLVDIDKAARGR